MSLPKLAWGAPMKQILNINDAGKQLAEKLKDYVNKVNVVVLAIAPDGVPLAVEVAKFLHAPLDVCLIRRLAIPGLNIASAGTVISGGLWTLNGQVVSKHKLTLSELDEIAHNERKELEELEKYYRDGRPALDLGDQVTVLVDDGHTDALNLRAILVGLRSQCPKKLILAVPAIAHDRQSVIVEVVDQVVTILPWEMLVKQGYRYQGYESAGSHQDIRNALDESMLRNSHD